MIDLLLGLFAIMVCMGFVVVLYDVAKRLNRLEKFKESVTKLMQAQGVEI